MKLNSLILEIKNQKKDLEEALDQEKAKLLAGVTRDRNQDLV